MTIAERLKTIRKALKLSQIEFADALNINNKTVSYWERGTRDLQLSYILEISDKWNVSLDWLLLGIGNMNLKQDTNPQLTRAFNLAKTTAENANKTAELEILLNEFNSTHKALSVILPTIKTIKGQSFFTKFSHFLTGDGERQSIVLCQFLHHISYEKNLSVDNAKTHFIEMLKDFTVQKNKKSLLIVNESDKNNLLIWVEKNLDDTDCQLLVQDVQSTLESLKKSLSLLNKKACK